MYIWQQEDWPHMTWDNACFSNSLAEVNMLRGKLLGRLSMFGFEERNQSMLDSLTQEIVQAKKVLLFLTKLRFMQHRAVRLPIQVLLLPTVLSLMLKTLQRMQTASIFIAVRLKRVLFQSATL